MAGPRRWDYITPASPHPFLAGLATRFAPSPIYYANPKSVSAQVIARYTQKALGPYDGESAPGQDVALVANNYGSGRAVYVSGDLGSTLASYRMTDHFQLVENIARALAKPEVEIEGAPGSLELVVRSQDNGRRLLVHLVNFTGEMTRPIRRVLPLDNLRLKVPPGFQHARALVSGRELSLRDGTLALPRVEEYEVIVVEP